MKKNFIPFVVSLTSLFAMTAHADLSQDLVQKYRWGDYNFDGNKVSNGKSGQMVNFDNSKKTVSANGATGTYNMTWGSEDADDSKILTVTEARVTPVGNDISKVYARSSTFTSDRLRSSTFCFGSSKKASSLGAKVTDNDMKCVTATKQSCKRLMDAYSKEAGKEGTTVKNMKDVAVGAQYCNATLDSYKKMAVAFANQSDQIERIHSNVVDADTKRVKSLVDKTTGSGTWDPTNVSGATKTSALEKMADSYATSMNGIEVLSTALQVCASANPDFADTKTSSGGGMTSGAATNGRQ